MLSSFTTNHLRIWNPLAGLSTETLRTQVSAFCSEYHFQEHESTFFRGALAAQNPSGFEEIPELTEDDKHWLRRETTHKWHLPRQLYFTIAICSLGSALQGWDNTGANGANLSFPKEFGIENNEWLIGTPSSLTILFNSANGSQASSMRLQLSSDSSALGRPIP